MHNLIAENTPLQLYIHTQDFYNNKFKVWLITMQIHIWL